MASFVMDDSRSWVARVDDSDGVVEYPVVGWRETDSAPEPIVYNGCPAQLDMPHRWVDESEQVRVVRCDAQRWVRAMERQIREEEANRD